MQCTILAGCLALASACAGRDGGYGGARAARAGSPPADSSPPARITSGPAGTDSARPPRPDTVVVGAIPSARGVFSTPATEAPWSPPPGPEPPRPTASYPDLRSACDSAAAWVGRATGAAPTREEGGAAYEGRPGCTLRAEYRAGPETSDPDSLFLRGGWAYVKYFRADGPGSTMYALESRDAFCRVRATWPVPDDDEPESAASDEPPSTLELGCVRRGPLDDLRVAIEHLGRSPDPVCLELAREAHARLGASRDRDGRAWARFEDGHGTVRFEHVRGARPRGKYDPTVAGIGHLTAVERYALAGQVALNEARALGRPDTASIERRCTLFDRTSRGGP